MRPSAASFACNTYAYTMSHDARRCLAHLAELGFREIELMMYPGHLWPHEIDAAGRKELARHIASLGLTLVTLNMPNIDMNIAAASAEMRRHTLDLLIGIVELAGDLGAAGVVIGPGKANPLFPAPRERLTGYFFAALDELARVAARAGTALWVENMPFAFLPDLDSLMAALDRHGDPGIGIVYDVANGYFIGEEICAALRRIGERLQLVHLSDTGRSVYKHDPVGEGTVPFAGLPAVLAEIACRRLPVLEIISPHADRDILASADKLAALGFSSLNQRNG